MEGGPGVHRDPRFWRFDAVDGTAMLIPRAGLTPADDASLVAAMKSFADRVGGTDPH